MSYRFTCMDKTIIIKNIYEDHNNFLTALKNYLKNDDRNIESTLYKCFTEIDTLFKDNLISSVNMFSKIIFENDYIDRVKYNLIIDIINDLETEFTKIDLKGFFIWITLFKKRSTQINYKECEEIINTINILTPHFDNLNVFSKYDDEGKRDPFAIDIERKCECYYLYPVLSKCIVSKTNAYIYEE